VKIRDCELAISMFDIFFSHEKLMNNYDSGFYIKEYSAIAQTYVSSIERLVQLRLLEIGSSKRWKSIIDKGKTIFLV